MSLHRALVVAVTSTIVVAGCTTEPDRADPPTSQPRMSLPAAEVTVLTGETPGDLALATSRALFAHAPVVVLAGEDDPAARTEGAALAERFAGPLLLTAAQAGGALRDELRRLDPVAVVPLGDAATRWAEAATPPIPVVAADSDLPLVARAERTTPLLVLTTQDTDTVAATATAWASGAQVLSLPDADPRTDPTAIEALASRPPGYVIALGAEFGPPERLTYRLEVARTGVQLPGGGQVVYPGRRMIALYGHPGTPGLGVLGEQPLDDAIARAQETAEAYRALVDEPVVPVFELITTIAARAPGPDGDYSTETPVETLRPWVTAAGDAGVYVVLDLQPGRTDFLTQARRYEELLLHPHVGLALDPEWRLAPDQRHLEQIGSVPAAEVNEVSEWLAELTRAHRLPQKLLVLHQFRLSMITDRGDLDTGHDELAVLIHADGHGTESQKLATWRNLLTDPPPNVWWGWKNFYDEDRPTFTPEQTVAVDPSPVFVSYQ